MTVLHGEDTRTGDARPGLPPVPGTAADVMIRRPKTRSTATTVGQARLAFADDHVHMLLLVEDGRLLGTVVRADLSADAAPGDAALSVARLDGRTVAPDDGAEAIRSHLVATGRRRLAVVSDTGALLGLVCLKRNHTGFCSDEGVASRAAGRTDPC